MKINFLLFLSFILFFSAQSQDFTGQWKGEFTDRSTAFSNFGGDQCEYTVDIECVGNRVSGYSYTYFSDGGKNYYTICKLVGFINRKQKYIELKETERTKTNVPVTIRNCFQIHKLTYFKQGDTATLDGKWEPVPNQQGDCGFGKTLLTRRELKNSYPNFNAAASKTLKEKTPALISKKSVVAKRVPPVKNVAKTKIAPPKKNTVAIKKAPTTSNKKAVVAAPVIKKQLLVEDTVGLLPKKFAESTVTALTKFEKRNNTVLQTISVEQKTIKVDLYDNGEVDGDSISLFYNGKLLLSSKRLSEKAISLTIDVEDDIENELVMYAENLGTISPNTALMVVTDGKKRYEVRITSDLQKSGVINFVHMKDH